MSESNPPSDPTSSSPASDGTDASSPAWSSAPPPGATPPSSGDTPPPSGDTPPPPAYGAPPPPPPASAAPASNPYGGYTQAPPAAAGYGQVMVGSLPYVEHHFGQVATFGPRFLAYLIDYLLTLLGFIPMILGIVVMAASSTPSGYDEYGNYQSSSASGAGVGVGLLLIFLGFALMIGIQIWNRWYRTGRTGQSVGKQVVGLKVINTVSGQTIGMGMAFVRDIINGLISPITQLWMLWDPNRQTLGDMVAKSTVIVVPKS